MDKQYLEFVLTTYDASLERIKNSLQECGENLEVFLLPNKDLTQGENFRINIHTHDPTLVFDICAQFGKIKSVKVK